MRDSIEQVNSIFEQPWWLDAVAPGQWEAAEIEKNGRIIARLPYIKTNRFGSRVISVPEYTQTLGYWIEDTGAKNAKRFARQKDIISELIQKLPKEYNADFYLDHTCDYLLPFKWNGYHLQVQYSYRLNDLKDIDALWRGLADNIRREIKKAQKIVIVKDDHPIDDLITLQKKTFERQGRKIKNSELLKQLDNALLEHNARKLLCAVDADGKIHAASYFVYDSNCCYYLIGGGDPELRTSGASSLLMWEGIKFASNVSRAFDFEGSMIEPIERFFRAFGGVPTPYWRVTKMNGILSLSEYFKPRIKSIIGWN